MRGTGGGPVVIDVVAEFLDQLRNFGTFRRLMLAAEYLHAAGAEGAYRRFDTFNCSAIECEKQRWSQLERLCVGARVPPETLEDKVDLPESVLGLATCTLQFVR